MKSELSKFIATEQRADRLRLRGREKMFDKSNGIVAGVDGSPNGLGAADWALQEAQRRGCSLTLVEVWQDGVTAPFVTLVGSNFTYVQTQAQRMVEG
jgi:nucleotide-binding universal stress UspA family protein